LIGAKRRKRKNLKEINVLQELPVRAKRRRPPRLTKEANARETKDKTRIEINPVHHEAKAKTAPLKENVAPINRVNAVQTQINNGIPVKTVEIEVRKTKTQIR
jgi:hypothetical protein